MGLAGLEALQVEQHLRELLITAQDVFVIEGELQDILQTGQARGGSLRHGSLPGGALSLCHLGPHLHSTMNLVVEGLVPLRVPAVGHHPCLGMVRGRCGQPQLHIAVSFGHCG